MWRFNLIWVTSIQLFFVAASSTQSRYRGRYKASVFSDLTPAEITSVKNFLMDQEILNLAPKDGTLKQNSLLMMELNVPKKHQVLNFLDKDGPKPQREAKVVIVFADQPNPNVTEYIVGPLPHPYYFRAQVYRGNKTIRFESRPVTSTEYRFIHEKLLEVMMEVNHILLETSGYSYSNCTERCLTFTDVAPRGLKSGDRRSWFIMIKEVEGYFLHPIGFELLLDHRSLDPKKWTVEKLWYNGQYFNKVEELVRKYERNELEKVQLSDDTENDLFSTFIPRGEYKTKSNVHGPKICEPQGKRYRVLGNYVEYAGWSFAYRSSTSAGMQVYDLQYNNERIAYEISIQEAIAFYSGVPPSAMQTKSIDSGWGMGTVDYELAKGIDCPEVATYQDVYHFYDAVKPIRYRNAVCIFELPTAVPLRRHFDSNYMGGYNFYAGLENHVLVLRTTSTVYNYDYIWDFIFYQNGVVEVKVHPTGYIQPAFLTPNGLLYGHKVQNNILGNLHTHLIHYKVDLDIAVPTMVIRQHSDQSEKPKNGPGLFYRDVRGHCKNKNVTSYLTRIS
ncbi:hypothetical protein GDO86_018351 [Hymenochirus boettgeri]|uniref:Amine oxidase n=1 Tax=Hymenochirus boettgeri TaxID=247094 RepID=A0A8T2IGI2_9PIPI|nr:hypothetical protein GDO86_018351 [Hymenochirus boettgeri]